jgi:hypothetical protein
VGPRYNRLPTAAMRQTGILPATNKIKTRFRKRNVYEMTMRYIWIQGQAAKALTAQSCTQDVSCLNPGRDTQQS